MIISPNDIPYDLEELLFERDVSITDIDSNFDIAMIELGLFEYGGTRRSHRLITSKATDLGIDGVIELLTGIPISKFNEKQMEINKNLDIEKMFKLAKALDYVIIDNDISKYIK